jgi:hypothetical protein
MPLNADLPAPGEDSVRGQLGAVVADDHSGLPRSAIRSVSSRTTLSPDIDVSGTAQALAGHVIDDVEHRNRRPDAI